MFNNDATKEATRSVLLSSIKGLANTGAAAAAFFLTPLIYSQSVDWIRDFTTQHYGAAWADLADFGWFVLVGFLTFFGARASVSTLILMGGLAVATKFL